MTPRFNAARAEQLARVLRDHEREGINRLRNIASEAGALLDAAREEIADRDAALEACQRRLAELVSKESERG